MPHDRDRDRKGREMKNYEFAKNLFGFFSFVAWILMIGGAIFAVIGLGQGRRFGDF